MIIYQLKSFLGLRLLFHSAAPVDISFSFPLLVYISSAGFKIGIITSFCKHWLVCSPDKTLMIYDARMGKQKLFSHVFHNSPTVSLEAFVSFAQEDSVHHGFFS